MKTSFQATRSAGLACLKAFVPSASDAVYGRTRNYDHGPDQRDNVSMLSPYLSHRLIGEWEVIEAVVNAHGLSGASKFVDEVLWRTYWKGWLQHRPQVWSEYLNSLSQPLSPEQSQALQRAENGCTGIACFDAWACELKTLGYLHNHARMWFASIWVFTLQLPWSRGADFFMRHLIDGDGASNTLSWRWVAGLHTQGKRYLASEANIEKFTGGRFGHLPELAGSADVPTFEVQRPVPLELVDADVGGGRLGLLITELDQAPLPIPEHAQVAAVAQFSVRAERSPTALAPAADSFSQQSLRNTLQGLCAKYEAVDGESLSDPDAMIRWAHNHQLDGVVVADLPVGPGCQALGAVGQAADRAGLEFHRVIRSWDKLVWPFCQKGFFGLKKHIPRIVEQVADKTASRF